MTCPLLSTSVLENSVDWLELLFSMPTILVLTELLVGYNTRASVHNQSLDGLCYRPLTGLIPDLKTIVPFYSSFFTSHRHGRSSK